MFGKLGNLIVAHERRRKFLTRRQLDRIVSELLQASADGAAKEEA